MPHTYNELRRLCQKKTKAKGTKDFFETLNTWQDAVDFLLSMGIFLSTESPKNVAEQSALEKKKSLQKKIARELIGLSSGYGHDDSGLAKIIQLFRNVTGQIEHENQVRLHPLLRWLKEVLFVKEFSFLRHNNNSKEHFTFRLDEDALLFWKPLLVSLPVTVWNDLINQKSSQSLLGLLLYNVPNDDCFRTLLTAESVRAHYFSYLENKGENWSNRDQKNFADELILLYNFLLNTDFYVSQYNANNECTTIQYLPEAIYKYLHYSTKRLSKNDGNGYKDEEYTNDLFKAFSIVAASSSINVHLKEIQKELVDGILEKILNPPARPGNHAFQTNDEPPILSHLFKEWLKMYSQFSIDDKYLLADKLINLSSERHTHETAWALAWLLLDENFSEVDVSSRQVDGIEILPFEAHLNNKIKEAKENNSGDKIEVFTDCLVYLTALVPAFSNRSFGWKLPWLDTTMSTKLENYIHNSETAKQSDSLKKNLSIENPVSTDVMKRMIGKIKSSTHSTQANSLIAHSSLYYNPIPQKARETSRQQQSTSLETRCCSMDWSYCTIS